MALLIETLTDIYVDPDEVAAIARVVSMSGESWVAITLKNGAHFKSETFPEDKARAELGRIAPMINANRTALSKKA